MSAVKIDKKTYPRLKHFNYFRTMGQPYMGLTVNVDITEMLRKIKEDRYPFFLSVLYGVSRAANGVPELRRRIVGDEILEYDWCDTSHTISLEDGTYCYCRLNSNMPFLEYLCAAERKEREARQAGSLEDGEEGESLLFVSCIPWVTYTAIIQPTPVPADSNPRITFARYFEQNEKWYLPVSILANHALVDGIHVARFYENIDLELKVIQ